MTREEIERRLWPNRNVGFDHSLDVVVSRLRSVLGDKGTSPRYIQTVPRRGYRFIEPVTTKALWKRRLLTYAAIALLAAIAATIFVRTRYDRFVPQAPQALQAP